MRLAHRSALCRFAPAYGSGLPCVQCPIDRPLWMAFAKENAMAGNQAAAAIFGGLAAPGACSAALGLEVAVNNCRCNPLDDRKLETGRRSQPSVDMVAVLIGGGRGPSTGFAQAELGVDRIQTRRRLHSTAPVAAIWLPIVRLPVSRPDRLGQARQDVGQHFILKRMLALDRATRTDFVDDKCCCNHQSCHNAKQCRCGVLARLLKCHRAAPFNRPDNKPIALSRHA